LFEEFILFCAAVVVLMELLFFASIKLSKEMTPLTFLDTFLYKFMWGIASFLLCTSGVYVARLLNQIDFTKFLYIFDIIIPAAVILLVIGIVVYTDMYIANNFIIKGAKK